MISDEDLLDANISDIRYSEDLNVVPIFGSVKLDSVLVTRPDIIINRYYNGNMAYLKLILDFNKLNDISDMEVGQVFELPNVEAIKEICYIEVLDDQKLPGVNNTTDSTKVNKQPLDISKITAAGRLKITVDPVKYDSNSGKITL